MSEAVIYEMVGAVAVITINRPEARNAVNLPVAEPDRFKKAHGHLEAMVGQAKEMWKHILAETDDARRHGIP
mgnify:CR=1 FL=1